MGRSKRGGAAFPFGIDRNLATPLAEQVADGLRKCILSHRFKDGGVLPSLSELVEALGVSQRVARDGIQMLAAEGLAVVRPRSGVRVLAPTEDATRGRILGVFSDKQRVSYYYSVLVSEMERILAEERYGFEAVYVHIQPNGSRDMSAVSRMLRSPFDLTFSLYAPAKVEKFLLESGVPYIPMGSQCGGGGAALTLKKDAADADAAFAARCAELGVRTAWLATYAACRSRTAVSRALERVGISVEWQCIPAHFGFGYLGNIEQSGFEAAKARLSGGRPLPDVVVAMDDYYLRGVLSAIAALRLDVPGDVRVAGVVNEGFLPSAPVPLACFKVDARRDAQEIASAILSYLSGERRQDACFSKLEFQDGPSLGGRAERKAQ